MKKGGKTQFRPTTDSSIILILFFEGTDCSIFFPFKLLLDTHTLIYIYRYIVAHWQQVFSITDRFCCLATAVRQSRLVPAP